jgi:hypothetical protein
MFGAATPYVVAICTLIFCGISALTLFAAVDHFDPPGAESATEPRASITVTSYATERIAV